MITGLFSRIAFGVVGVAAPALLFALAVPRLIPSFGTENALPLVTARVFEQSVPLSDAQYAVAMLGKTLDADGDGQISRAEMTALAANGKPAGLGEARFLVMQGLRRAPLNPRGWTLLCEIDAALAPALAPRCMDTGFFIAPYDWFTARRRALLAAALWPNLSPDVRKAAAQRVKLMWEADDWSDHRLRASMYDIYRAPNGPQLLASGFRSDRAEMRLLNGWLIRQRMYAKAP